MASSRVGERTTACGPFPEMSIRSKIGMPKAAVLPVPVCACPIRSFPVSAVGIAAFWMGVGSSKPISSTAFKISGFTPSSVNVSYIAPPCALMGTPGVLRPFDCIYYMYVYSRLWGNPFPHAFRIFRHLAGHKKRERCKRLSHDCFVRLSVLSVPA